MHVEIRKRKGVHLRGCELSRDEGVVFVSVGLVLMVLELRNVRKSSLRPYRPMPLSTQPSPLGALHL